MVTLTLNLGIYLFMLICECPIYRKAQVGILTIYANSWIRFMNINTSVGGSNVIHACLAGRLTDRQGRTLDVACMQYDKNCSLFPHYLADKKKRNVMLEDSSEIYKHSIVIRTNERHACAFFLLQAEIRHQLEPLFINISFLAKTRNIPFRFRV